MSKKWCVKEEYEKAFMDIIEKIPEEIKEEALELRKAYENNDLGMVATCQEMIETKIKCNLFNHNINVEIAYIISKANDCNKNWEGIS